MKREAKRILGINPGTRYLRLAVFHDTELLDWRVKTFRGKWSKKKEKRILEIITEQIELYDINGLAIKKLYPSRGSKNLKLLVSRIKALAKRNRIMVQSFSINQLERYYLSDEKPNRRNLAEKIVSEYPVLVHELEKEKSHENSYHLRMFEAVALGMMVKNHQYSAL